VLEIADARREQGNMWEWKEAMTDLPLKDRLERPTWLGMQHKPESERTGKKEMCTNEKGIRMGTGLSNHI